MDNRYTLHHIKDDPHEAPMYALICEDETGYVLGERDEVIEIAGILAQFLETGEHAGDIEAYDERLGLPWLTISEAADKAHEETGEHVPAVTIRKAAERGAAGESSGIIGATNRSGIWKVPIRQFRYWLQNRPKPGPQPANE